MRNDNIFIRIVTGILSCFTCVFSACDQSQEEVQEERPEYVRVLETDSSVFMDDVTVTGNIRGWERAFITGQTGVIIEEILADEGDFVRKGQLLVQMQESRLNEAEARLELARKNLRRMENLLKAGSIARQRYDEARTEYQSALSNYEQIRENITLTSPITGVVSEKYFVQGETYVPSADAPAILEIVDINPVKMEVNLQNRYYSEIAINDTVPIRIDNFPDTTFRGIIYKKAPTLNEESRTFGTEIKIGNPEYLLRPGMFSTAVFELGEERGIYVPASAILKQEGTANEYVFLVQEGIAVRQNVETGIRTEGMVQITEGLRVGVVIVEDGAAKLEEGEAVIVKTAEQ